MFKRMAFFVFCWLLAVIYFSTPPVQAMGRRHKTFQINLKVDFGPAGKPAFKDPQFWVEEGTTAKEVVSQVFPVLSGRSCCSLREVIEIGGVKVDPLKNRWWVCELNGSRKFSPQKKKLKSGDRLEWKYIQNRQ